MSVTFSQTSSIDVSSMSKQDCADWLFDRGVRVLLDAKVSDLRQTVADLDETERMTNVGIETKRHTQRVASRKGRNPSGNVPYARKFYRAILPESPQDFRKLPRQARFMAIAAARWGNTSMSGREIGDLAKQKGLITTIPSNALFAYYRKKLQHVGAIVQTG